MTLKEDRAWLKKNYRVLEREYDGEFIVIKDQKVVLHGKELMAVLRREHKKYGRTNLLRESFALLRQIEAAAEDDRRHPGRGSFSLDLHPGVHEIT